MAVICGEMPQNGSYLRQDAAKCSLFAAGVLLVVRIKFIFFFLFYAVFLAYIKIMLYLCGVNQNNNSMKVAIVGSRSAGSIDIGAHLKTRPSEIISGGAVGVDTLAAEYAQHNNISLTVIKPNYEKYGRRAPHVRNREIVMRADWVLAFWDGKSKGTESSINQARRMGKHVEIVKI